MGCAVAAAREPGAGGTAVRGLAGAAGEGTGTSSARETPATLAAEGRDSALLAGSVTGDAVVVDRRGGRHGRCVITADVAESAGHLVWIDCEMTGLDLSLDKLIEVAVLVTDSELNPVDPGLDLIISADDADLDDMNEVVSEMHAKSGLTDEVRASTLTVAEVEQQLLAYIKRFVPDRRTAPLCGNSIGTDRGFLARDMPELDDHLHYRMIDVSSIKELARRWFPRVYFAQPQKGLAHRALADIIESVRELAYYRQTLFVDGPGPSTSEAQAASARVADSFAALFAAEDAGVPGNEPPAASDA